MKNREIIMAGMLALLSVVLELTPIVWKTPWGMDIDLVGLPWLLSGVLFGLYAGLLTSAAAGFVIGLIAPSSFLGAGMKLAATIPLVLGLAALRKRLKKKKGRIPLFMLAGLLAVLIRTVAMIFMNYYIALPLWLKQDPATLFQEIPLWVIYVPNLIQSMIELVLCYLLVFKTKLFRYYRA